MAQQSTNVHTEEHLLLSTEIGWFDIEIPFMSSFVGFGIELVLILGLAILYRARKNSSFIVFFESIYEKVFEFFEDILGKEEKSWIKKYVTIVFFVILSANLIGFTIEFIAPVFGLNESKHFILEHYLTSLTTDINFNIAMAVVSVLLVLFVQLRHLWTLHFIYDFFPVFGKGYLQYERWQKSPIVDWLIFIPVKVFDIIISVFLGLLEIIGTAAKVISLSFRLFGNMTSGWVLLGMLYAALGGATVYLTSAFWGFEFPVLFPLLIFAQELLVALIQALVFPLLIAIFIKVAKSAE